MFIFCANKYYLLFSYENMSMRSFGRYTCFSML